MLIVHKQTRVLLLIVEPHLPVELTILPCTLQDIPIGVLHIAVSIFLIIFIHTLEHIPSFVSVLTFADLLTIQEFSSELVTILEDFFPEASSLVN